MSASGYYNKMLKKIVEIEKKQEETKKKLVLMELSEFIKAMIKDDNGDEFAAVQAFQTFLNEVKKVGDGIAIYIESIIIIEGLKGYLKNDENSLYGFFRDQKELKEQMRQNGIE